MMIGLPNICSRSIRNHLRAQDFAKRNNEGDASDHITERLCGHRGVWGCQVHTVVVVASLEPIHKANVGREIEYQHQTAIDSGYLNQRQTKRTLPLLG
jgi:hypothetical protein